jgi:large subunit ribosomal protein L17
MRHGRAGYHLTRKTAHRTAMLRNLAAGVFEHGQIVTTIPKAKAVQPFVEQIVTLAKQGDLAARRRVIAKLGGDRHGFEWLFVAKRASDDEKNHVNELLERNRYGELRSAPRLVKHIFDHVGPKFADRAGGYTRIVKLGKQRYGDNAELCVLQFVGAEEGPEIGGKPSTRRRTADKRTAFLAKLKKGK